MKAFGIGAFCLVVLGLFFLAESSVLKSYPVPVFVWSDSDRFLNGGRSWYPASATTNDVRQLISSLTGSSASTPFPLSSSPSSPEIVVVFLEPALFFGRSELVGATRQTSQPSQLRKWKVMVEGAKSSLVIPYTYDSSLSEMSQEERSFYLVGQLDSLFEGYFKRCEDCEILVEPMDQVSESVWSSFFLDNSRIVDVSNVGTESYLRDHEEFFTNGKTELIIVHLPADAPLSDYDLKITNVINYVSQMSENYVAVLSSDDMYLPTQSSMSLRESPVKYEWAPRTVRDDSSESPSPSPPNGGDYQYKNRWPEYVW
eukprot:CAMPEP_0201488276 /NCGR_PEP_ID=MMETSP0151_2-20130828/17862_1 /ASSEMBLY_ACC=CAM_ASM_000257 /TAXON_ID=200890 /ORGANISM="Paramoeba atlantica, Strain 621/1 / CCAP 1560/9" /LENGTH=313 /DNA_ID=CAMNT_0047873535 /DNA_START=161 /DNA_END=1099 /DNA_ORIENTATION=+